jgi:hypothetical protein
MNGKDVHSVARLAVPAVALALLLAACGMGVPTARQSHPASKVNHPLRASTAGAATSAPSVEVYAVPGSGPADAQIYSQGVGSSVGPQQLASGVAAEVLPSTGIAEDLAIYSSSSGPVVYSLSPSTAPSRLTTSGVGNTQPGSVLLSSQGDIYLQADSQVIDVDSSSGTVVASYNLPSLTADSVAGSVPSYDKGLVSASAVGTVQALVLLPSGDVLALQYTGRAAAVDDLTTGTVHELAGYGDLGGGTLAPDGDVYVVAWRSNDPAASMDVLQIDPATLDVIGSTSTGLSPAPTDNIQTEANSSENILVYVAQGSGASMDSYLWSASSTGLQQLDTLPVNIGLYVSDFGESLYLYGGPAENSVSRLDLTDMSLTQDVSGFATPSGSFVLALG